VKTNRGEGVPFGLLQALEFDPNGLAAKATTEVVARDSRLAHIENEAAK
jgi:hypothetical protein